MEASFGKFPVAGLRSGKNADQDGSSTKLCTADQHRQECRLRKSQENREAVRAGSSLLSNPHTEAQKAKKKSKYMAHYRNAKAILCVDIWTSLGSSQVAASNYNLKSADVMTQCYQQFFTQTSSTYVPHHNERKTAFRKFILQSSTLFPCTQSKDLALLSSCSRTLTEAHMYLYHKPTSSVPLSSRELLGGVVVKPYGLRVLLPLEKFGDFKPEEHTNAQTISVLIDL